MARYGNRYEFVAPEPKRSGWQDAADTLEGVLESEHRRRREQEDDRRARTQEGFEGTRVGEIVNEGKRRDTDQRQRAVERGWLDDIMMPGINGQPIGGAAPGGTPGINGGGGGGAYLPDLSGPPGNRRIQPSSDPALDFMLDDSPASLEEDDRNFPQLEAENAYRAQATPEGPGDPTRPFQPARGGPPAWDPERSADAANDRRGSQIRRGDYAYEKGLEEELANRNRQRQVSQAVAAGVDPTRAPFMVENPQQYRMQNPESIDPRVQAAEMKMDKYRADLQLRNEQARVRSVNGQGGRSGRDFLPGARARIDDLRQDIRGEEAGMAALMKNRDPEDPATYPSFVADSTARAGRIAGLRGQLAPLESAHDEALSQAMGRDVTGRGISPNTRTPPPPQAGADPEREKAARAIANGKDPAAVKALYKQRTGRDY